tara:strand:- start:3743 stop:5680 length:1938 start_codon:yes stop_codon:yes gene_type:complete
MNLLGPAGSTGTQNGALVDPKKFFGEEKYDQYYEELLQEGRLGGENLTSEERKEGAKKYRKDKKDFKKFVDDFFKKEKQTETKSLSSKKPKLLTGSKPPSPQKDLKPEKQVKSQKITSEDLIIKKLTTMQSLLESISASIKADQERKKKSSEELRKTNQREQKEKRESALENKATGAGKNIGSKLLSPIKGPFDAIANFFKNVLLGAAVQWLLNFIKDPIGFFVNPMIDFFNNIISSILSPLNDFINGLNENIENFITDFNSLIDEQMFGLGEKLPDIPSGAINIPNIPIPQIPKIQQESPAKMQRGGYIGVGKPHGDSVPTLLERGEYVLNRNAVKAIGRNTLDSANFGRYGRGRSGVGMQKGGMVEDITVKELEKDESLSSLTPGVNDYIHKGSMSVVSNTPWSSIKDSTLLYPYLDSEGQPTIGYGSAQMRGITMKSAPITVKIAKEYLRSDVSRILGGMRDNLKYFNSLSAKQKAAIAMFEYNAGEGSSWSVLSPYKKFRRALQSGNIRAAIPEMRRTGPSKTRLETEKLLLSSGPQQLVGPKIVGSATVGEEIGGKSLLNSVTDDQGLSRFIPKQFRQFLQRKLGGDGPMINVVPIPLSSGGVNRNSSMASAAQSSVPDFSATSGDIEIVLTKAILNVTS